jgi:hypothetical protein
MVPFDFCGRSEASFPPTDRPLHRLLCDANLKLLDQTSSWLLSLWVVEQLVGGKSHCRNPLVLARDLRLTPGPQNLLLASAGQGLAACSWAPGPPT